MMQKVDSASEILRYKSQQETLDIGVSEGESSQMLVIRLLNIKHMT